MKRILLSVLWISLALAACKKQPYTIDYKYAYFPLETGHTVVYEVDSIIYSPLYVDGRDTFHWLVREVVAGQFTDIEGRTAYRIERYIRQDTSKPWQTGPVWYAVRNQTSAERVEENLRFIRLVFPPKAGETWQGNAYIPSTDTFKFYTGWTYRYDQVDVPATVNGLSFDSTLTIIEVDDENLLERRWSVAQYAKGIGLVYRELYNLSFVGSSIPIGNDPWEEKANRGYILRMRIKSVQ